MRALLLIRGLPGSGKSTLAKLLLHTPAWDVHFEADQFFVNPTTHVYTFDAHKIKDAHQWCVAQTESALTMNMRVIVANTFTTHTEVHPYLMLAQRFHLIPQIILCQNEFGSIHQVPDATIARMRTRFQYEIQPPQHDGKEV